MTNRKKLMFKKTLFSLAALTVALTLPAGAEAQPASAQTQAITAHDLTVGGVRVHYLKAGHGPPVLMLHGWPETSHAWVKVMPLLAAHYTLIAPDLPGLGQSSAPQSYDTRTVAAEMHAFVRRLGYTQTYLVVHDLGTWVGYAYTAQYPADVRRLVIMDAALPGITVTPGPPVPSALNEKVWQFSFNDVPGLPEQLVAGRERLFLTWFFRNKSHVRGALTPADVTTYVRAYTPMSKMHAGFEYYRAGYKDSFENKQLARTKLTMPVLALGGADGGDGTGMFKTMQLVATHVKGGAVPNCGHYIEEERPGYLASQVEEFFDAP